MWKLKREDILEQRDQWLYIFKEKKLANSQLLYEEWKKNDNNAREAIQLCLIDSVPYNVST